MPIDRIASGTVDKGLVPPPLTHNQIFARWSYQTCSINRAFPARPTADEIAREYTPERIMRLAKYVAKSRRRAGPEQYEEDVAQCVFSILQRIAEYNSGVAVIKDTYSFYHWLLFHTRTDLRDVRRKESRLLAGSKIGRITAATPAPEPLDPSIKLDITDAIGSLTKKQKQVILDTYVHGKSQQEIADELGMSQVAVSRLLTRGIERMKGHMGVNPLDDPLTAQVGTKGKRFNGSKVRTKFTQESSDDAE